MANLDEQGDKVQTQEVQFNPGAGISPEEFSKSILLDVGHEKIPNNLFKAFLENKKYIYYGQTFAIFTHMTDKFALTWNFFAFFMPSFWLLYRKMYVYGLISFIVSIILTITGFWLNGSNALDAVNGLSNSGIMTDVLLGFIVNVVVGLIGNYLYFTHSRKKLIHIMNTFHPEQQEDEAKLQGGVDPKILWIVCGVCICAYLLFTLIMLG